MDKKINSKENWSLIIISILLLFTFASGTLSDTLKPKTMALFFIVSALVYIVFKRKVENCLNLVTISTSAYVLWFGISTLYANSGKFAIAEYVNILTGFTIFIFIVFRDKISLEKTLWAITSVSGFIAFLSLEGAFIRILYSVYETIIYEIPSSTLATFDGSRLNGIYGVTNVFATLLGTVLFLSLYMFINAKDKKTKYIQGFFLILFATCVLLTTSLGGIFSLGVAVLAFLLFSNEEIRAKGLIVILETVFIALICVSVTLVTYEIYQDASMNVFPVLAVFAGSALLVLADRFINEKLFTTLVKYVKYTFSFIVALILVGLSLVAFLLSQTTSLNIPTNTLYVRTVYLDEGTYKLDALLNQDLSSANISVYTRDEIGVIINEDVLIFSEDVTNASSDLYFDIPEGTREVNIYIKNTSDSSITLNSISVIGSDDVKNVALAYKYIPINITNRIQGLATNDSLMTRLQYIDASIKLFLQKPIGGHGLGGFENALQSVQSYQFETKYAHNHFFQTLVDGGIIGFVLYVTVLGACIYSLFKARKESIIAPMLFASLVMIFFHGANEFSLSIPFFIPFYFAVFALIATECSKPIEKLDENKDECLIGLIVSVSVFACLLTGNLIARLNLQSENLSLDILETNMNLDVYETNDYYLTYVTATYTVTDPEIVKNAEKYAEKLEKAQSNIISMYLTEYYVYKDNPQKCLELLERYINYSINDPSTWNNAISTYITALLNSDNLPKIMDYKDEHVSNIKNLLDKHYTADMNSITKISLSDKSKSLVSIILALENMSTLDEFYSYAGSLAYDSDYDLDLNYDGWYDSMAVSDEYVNILENPKVSNGDEVRFTIPYNVNSIHQITYLDDNIESIKSQNEELLFSVANGETRALIDMSNSSSGYIDLVITFNGSATDFSRLIVTAVS
ncbi:MAG: O-antigen ligase family protein [Clostridia bacterium]